MNEDSLRVEVFPINGLHTFHNNPRKGDVDAIAESLAARGQYRPIVVNRGSFTGRPLEILAGNHTFMAAKLLGWKTIQATTVDVDDEGATQIVLADNRLADLGDYDDTILTELLQSLETFDGTGYDESDLEQLLDILNVSEIDKQRKGALADRFGIPPMTVIDTRRGEWQDRKRAWVDMIGDSREGRTAETFVAVSTNYSNWATVREIALGKNPSETEKETEEKYQHILTPYKGKSGVSEFYPCLTEILVSWFSAKGAHIIDPWAGGIVRGAVASYLGRDYTGIDLSANQVETNRTRIEEIGGLSGNIEYLVGDSRKVLTTLPTGKYGMVLGCPPYYGLEKYSDSPEDLSNMDTASFDDAMGEIFTELNRVLMDNAFAVFVVGSVRDPKTGGMRDMRALLYNIATSVGWKLSSDAVLVNNVGTTAMRVGRSFVGTRTLGRTHQDVLVFVKGNRKQAALACGDVEILGLESLELDEEEP